MVKVDHAPINIKFTKTNKKTLIPSFPRPSNELAKRNPQ